jgi:hypothetical protein
LGRGIATDTSSLAVMETEAMATWRQEAAVEGVSIARSGTVLRLAFVGCGVVLFIWAAATFFYTPGADIPKHVGLTMAAWVVWAVALRLVLALPARGWRTDLVIIVGLAIAMRAVMVLSPPSLSDDVYRSVWDSRLIWSGVNPYAYPPGAPELAPYRDEVIWPRVNHPQQRTPYPPLAVLFGAAAYAIAPERLMAMQMLAALADLGAVALLAWLLARCGLDPRRSVVVAWSPIGALHFAHSGHNDSLMILMVVAATLLLTFGRTWLAMVALGAGTMIKAAPAFLLPAFLRAAGVLGGVVWLAACVLMALPLIHDPGFVRGLLQESGSQQFNDSVHLVLERMLQPLLGMSAGSVASAVGLGGVAIAGLASWWWTRGTPREALVNGSRVLGVYILVAPVVEPWYFTWLAPLIAFELRGARGRPWFRAGEAPAWLWLAGTATLTELTYLPGGSHLWLGIRVAEYIPFFVLLALGLLARRRPLEAGVGRF